jgi:hypothetical protein
VTTLVGSQDLALASAKNRAESYAADARHRGLKRTQYAVYKAGDDLYYVYPIGEVKPQDRLHREQVYVTEG